VKLGRPRVFAWPDQPRAGSGEAERHHAPPAIPAVGEEQRYRGARTAHLRETARGVMRISAFRLSPTRELFS
jgi:hypothetical protein